MKSLFRIATVSLVGLSLATTIISSNSTQAQTNHNISQQENRAIPNGFRHLGEIEPEKNFDLDFTDPSENTPQTEAGYQLESQDSEMYLEEEDGKSGNQGDVEYPSIQLDVHEF